GSDRALVAAVAGTGAAGMRLMWTLPLFRSGVAYPDCVVVGPDVLARGGTGVRGAGFFGTDWGLATGGFAWRPGCLYFPLPRLRGRGVGGEGRSRFAKHEQARLHRPLLPRHEELVDLLVAKFVLAVAGVDDERRAAGCHPDEVVAELEDR